MKKKNKQILFVSILLVSLVSVLFMIPTQVEGVTTDMEVQLMNDGVPVGNVLSFFLGLEEVTDISVRIIYTTYGTEIDWTTLLVTGDVSLYWDGQTEVLLKETTITSYLADYNQLFGFTLSTYLDVYVNQGETIFDLIIRGHLNFYVEDIYGNALDGGGPWDDSAVFTITWVEDKGTFGYDVTPI